MQDLQRTAELIVADPSLGTATFGVIAVFLAMCLRRLLFAVALRAARRSSGTTFVIRRVQPPFEAFLLFLSLALVTQQAPDGLAGIGPAREIVALLMIASGTWLTLRLINGVGEAIVARHPYDTEDNYRARGILTQTNVLTRTLSSLVIVVGVSLALMTFPAIRQIGAGLLASAGIVGIAVGLAAKPVIGNLLAGLQIAFTQPIRLDDVLIIEGEWGKVESITRTYVVIRIWDDRRLIVPLQQFIEKPFQNWTRGSSQLLGTVFLSVDYRMPLEPLRNELTRLCGQDKDWDGRVAIIQVTDATERTMQLRALVSSADAPRNFDLRCRVREGLIDFIREHHPQGLPQLRMTGPTPDPPGTNRSSPSGSPEY